MSGIAKQVTACLEAARSGPPEVWISLFDEHAVLMAASEVEGRLDAGENLPLAGFTVAVKDNIDVAGLPTTAGCPAYAYHPQEDAPAIAGLRRAGAVVLGKTNMDQFATGLVGTRSPYGTVRNVADPRYIAGGSSSGSAVAVALGQVDFALGTDTAGSGRVPAALNGIVGFKPTRGLISTNGVVPACQSLDCVSVLAPTMDMARSAAHAASRQAPADPYPPVSNGPDQRMHTMGIPDPAQLDLEPERLRLWEAATARLAASGVALREVRMEDFLEAGSLVYEGSLVAERYAAVGRFVTAHPNDVEAVVRKIILDAGTIRAHRLAQDLYRLSELQHRVAATFDQVDVIVMPATPGHPLIEEVYADPFGPNHRLGLYNHFCNPLDLCALTVPAGRTMAGLPWAITLYGPALRDQSLFDSGATFVGDGPLGRAP